MFCASVFMLVSTISFIGQAAEQHEDIAINTAVIKEQPKTASKVEAKTPIVIESDNLSFSDATGDLFAEGNVSVVQDTDKILTDVMHGNSKETQIWIDGKANFLQPRTNLIGIGTHYNYTTRIGSMNNASGIVDRIQHISGKNIDILPDEMIIHDGTTTNCPAKVPDNHISAEKIEIWPGDKMIAYNAKFWIGKMVIFSLPKYQISLEPGRKESRFPRVGYRDSDGFYIKQYFEYPISDHIAAYTDPGYYSKIGFKNQYGLIDREKNFSLTLAQGDYRDSDANWIKKEPEFRFDYYSKRVGKLPVSYTFSAIYGKWVDSVKTSWHQDYSLYFTHDTIPLSKSLFLNLGTGVEQVRESYNDSVQNSLKFNTTLTKVVSPKMTAWTTYNYTQNNTSLFEYESTSLSKEWVNGLSYKFDSKNTVSYSQSYDLNTDKVYSNSYTWNRDLHCWQLAIAYKVIEKGDKTFTFNLTNTHW